MHSARSFTLCGTSSTATDTSTCNKNIRLSLFCFRVLSSMFFVPSLSWQNDGFDVRMAQQRGVFLPHLEEQQDMLEDDEANHTTYQKTRLLLSFPYVCPEPVLDKMIILQYRMAQK